VLFHMMRMKNLSEIFACILSEVIVTVNAIGLRTHPLPRGGSDCVQQGRRTWSGWVQPTSVRSLHPCLLLFSHTSAVYSPMATP
jgi:hypothetical protein